MSLKSQIAAAEDLETEDIEVPEWGTTITLRTPTLHERAKMMSRFVGAEGTQDLTEMYPALLIATCIDPETGAALFTDEDRDLILSKNGAVVERIAAAALRLAGMSADAVPTPGADSSSTESASTSTTSPNASEGQSAN